MLLARYTKQGNNPTCFNCCVASILNVDLDKIPPNFGPGSTGFVDFSNWLHDNYKLQLLWFKNTKEQIEGIKLAFIDIKCILIGESPRSTIEKPVFHAVVGSFNGCTFDFLHDPHDSNEWINSISTVIFFVSSV